MIDAYDIIWQDIVPYLGEFADVYDIRGIFDECEERGLVSFIEQRGYVWADDGEDMTEFNEIIDRHARDAAVNGEITRKHTFLLDGYDDMLERASGTAAYKHLAEHVELTAHDRHLVEMVMVDVMWRMTMTLEDAYSTAMGNLKENKENAADERGADSARTACVCLKDTAKESHEASRQLASNDLGGDAAEREK